MLLIGKNNMSLTDLVQFLFCSKLKNILIFERY